MNNFFKKESGSLLPQKRVGVEEEKPNELELSEVLEIRNKVDSVNYTKIQTKEEAISHIKNLTDFIENPFIDSLDATPGSPNSEPIRTLDYARALKSLMFKFQITELEVNKFIGRGYFQKPISTPYPSESILASKV